MNEHAGIISPTSAGETREYGYLGLLARVKDALNSAKEVSVPAEEIRPFSGQPRTYFNPESIRRLSDSIDAGGQTTSGMIRENPGETRYELIDGERRWRAVLQIPETRRPYYKAKLIRTDDEVVQYLVSGIANFNREPHTPIEVVETIDRFFTFGLPMKEIASLLGISEHWAYQMHGLKKLDPKVLVFLEKGRPKNQTLPVTAAIEISKIDRHLQFEIAERVLRRDIALEGLRGEVVKVGKRAGSPVPTREVSPLKRWESLGNKINVWVRQSSHMANIASTGGIAMIAASRKNETAVLLSKIREAQERLRLLEQFLANTQR